MYNEYVYPALFSPGTGYHFDARIIYRDVLWNLNGSGKTRVRRYYRRFLMGVTVNCVTDALWGILDAHRLTANAFDEDVQRSMQAGLNAHLSRPVEAGALFETLEKLIE